jgi:hypothetical protein
VTFAASEHPMWRVTTPEGEMVFEFAHDGPIGQGEPAVMPYGFTITIAPVV